MRSVKSLFWPPLENLREINAAIQLGAATSFIVSAVTAVLTYSASKGQSLFEGISNASYIDAGVFLLVGILIALKFRLAPLAGLAVYLLGQIAVGKVSFFTIVFTLNYVNAHRAVFMFHRLKKAGELESYDVPEPEMDPGILKRQKIARTILFILLAAFLVSLFLWLNKPHSSSAVSSQPQLQTTVNIDELPLPAGTKTFIMKSGEKIQGTILFEDEVYYSVKTVAGPARVVIKEDLRALPSS